MSSDTMTAERIAELRRLAEEVASTGSITFEIHENDATPTVWDGDGKPIANCYGPKCHPVMYGHGMRASWAIARHMAAADPQTVLALCDLAARTLAAEAERDRLMEEMDERKQDYAKLDAERDRLAAENDSLRDLLYKAEAERERLAAELTAHLGFAKNRAKLVRDAVEEIGSLVAENAKLKLNLNEGETRREAEKLTMSETSIANEDIVAWTCFHCGAKFTGAQRKWAAEHFGSDEGQTPVCLMRVPGENGLIAALRKAQDELAEWRSENAPLMLAIESQAADHVAALLREEEKGYARGLKDYSKVEIERNQLRDLAARLGSALESYRDDPAKGDIEAVTALNLWRAYHERESMSERTCKTCNRIDCVCVDGPNPTPPEPGWYERQRANMNERLTDAELEAEAAIVRGYGRLDSVFAELREHRRREAEVQEILKEILRTMGQGGGVPGGIWDAYLEASK